MNLENKTILLTGASSGIGKAVAQKLLNENCRLALIARRNEQVKEYVDTEADKKNQPLIIKCDVSKKDDVAAAYKLIKEKFGNIDIAILNAGIGHTVTPETFNSVYAEQTFGANMFGIIYWAEQILPEFLKSRQGIIAAVSSLADNRGFSGSGFYCASKAAASIFLEGLRVELKRFGVKVITIKPGFVKTPMTAQNKFDMPFLLSPERAAQYIIDGIKKEKRVIQFPWQTVFLTKLVGLLPGNFYEYLVSRVKTK
jgi:short-subunit dehydrogenase